MTMERYEAYKDSGVEWIGEIPERWIVRRVKTLATGKDTLFLDGDWIESNVIEREGIRYLTTGNVGEGRYKEQGAGFISKTTFDRLNCLKVLPGDVLISRLNEPLGRACLAPETFDEYVVAVDIVVLRGDSFLNRFMVYAMNEPHYAETALMYSRGSTMKRVSRTILGEFKLPLPSTEEQQAIADYLDAKTAEIDGLVADCEREVELLREYRKTVISEAVTKGLDPDAPMKDSGVEWIGEIPEGWLVRPSKTLFSEGKELRHPNDEQCTASQKYGIIPQAQYIVLENQRMVAADKNLDSWKHVEPGDFVISLRSFQGGLELSEITGCVTWHYIVLRGSCDVESTYYKYLFKTRKYIESLQRTCTYIRDGQDLRYSNFVQVPLPLPPSKEQVAIGTYLDTKTAEIDSLIEAKQSMADKLREYRKSLISEAVTGKFKVPGV